MARQLKPFPMPPSSDNQMLPSQQLSDQPDPIAGYSQQSQQQPLSSQQKLPKKQRKLLPIVLAAVVIIIVIGGAGAYWYKHHHKAAPTHPTNNNYQPQPSPSSSTSNSSSNGNYVSNGQDLNLSFTYPSNWSVTPSSNNNPNDQPITITSPLTSITSTNGSSVTGKAVVSIRPGSASLSELASGKATAAQNSIQIAYTHPTTAQQQYPYLTFINLDGGSDTTGAFQEVLITANQSFTKGGSITSTTLAQPDPIISAAFYQCSTESCTGSGETPLNILNNTWQNSSLGQQVLNILQSLQLH